MSEEQIKEISEHLGAISQWQISHEIADKKRHNDFPEMIKEAVEVQINGNLREITSHLIAQDVKLTDMSEKLDNLKIETAPIVESKNFLVSFRKFLLWVATPFAIIWAIWEYIISKIK